MTYYSAYSNYQTSYLTSYISQEKAIETLQQLQRYYFVSGSMTKSQEKELKGALQYITWLVFRLVFRKKY